MGLALKSSRIPELHQLGLLEALGDLAFRAINMHRVISLCSRPCDNLLCSLVICRK